MNILNKRSIIIGSITVLIIAGGFAILKPRVVSQTCTYSYQHQASGCQLKSPSQSSFTIPNCSCNKGSVVLNCGANESNTPCSAIPR
jgi:hypothetical protein